MHASDRAGRPQALSQMQRDKPSVHPDVDAAVDGFFETTGSIVMRREQGHPMSGRPQMHRRVHDQAFGAPDAEVGMDERDI
jgi:hypothetical protein